MPSLTLKNAVEYTILAATTAREIARSPNIPFLGSAAILVLSILECIESVRLNKDECVRMVEHIHEVLCVIIKLYSTSDTGVLLTTLLYDIARFTETLQKVFTLVKGQQRMGKIKQLFKQPTNAIRLESCRQALDHVLQTFKVKATSSMVSQIMHMKKDMKEQHEELVALLETQPDLSMSDSSSVTGTLASSGTSSGSFSMLPPTPKIFHGRESELHDVVKILIQDSARIAILGPGGMGKTSLATAALYDPKVEAKYSHRYFIPCQSSPTCGELVSTVAAHVGVEKGPNLSKLVAHYLSHVPRSLLILDNLETPWENSTSRGEVEEFLSLLADVPHLGLMITMRGAEYPAKVRWTRPFLAPLSPLSSPAALRTFIDIADDVHQADNVNELLELTGNLPLAVNLIASVASQEGCDKALSRWESKSIRMLSGGCDKRSSLDRSIMLSFTSPRMTTGAQELLSILSMLPDGLTDIGLVQINLPIPNILASKAILLKTSLAYMDKDQRVKVLVPIREHILATHPPTTVMKLNLRQYFQELLDLWNQFQFLNSADIVQQISQNLGNFNTILLNALSEDCPDATANIQSILSLNDFYRKTQDTYSPLLLHLSAHTKYWQDQPVYGDYLVEIFSISSKLPVMDDETQIAIGNEYFEHKDQLDQAKWYQALGLHFYWGKSNVTRALECFQKMLSLSDSTGSAQSLSQYALRAISQVMVNSGDPMGALAYANKAQEYAEQLGDIYGQAFSIYLQGRSQMIFANYPHAQLLFQNAKDLLISCGLQGGVLDMCLKSWEAEIHLLRTQYLESRKIQVSIASTVQPTTCGAILSNLNIALIDTLTGVDSKIVHENLKSHQFHLGSLYGWNQTWLPNYWRAITAILCLRDGDFTTANTVLAECFTSFQTISSLDETMYCLEWLGDLSTNMNNVTNTLGWTGILLALAWKSKTKVAMMQAFRCFAQIFAAQGDNETALSLFNVALDGFTLMDVHRWRADCMVHMANILECQGKIMKSIELWKTARLLFEKSSQTKDVTRINTKLAEVDSSILEKYEKQLQSQICLSVDWKRAHIENIEEDSTEVQQHQDVADENPEQQGC